MYVWLDASELAPESKQVIKEEDLPVVNHTIELDYSFWTTGR